jgi:RimJ/RimL family protein N-acetyltransferase
MKQIRIETERLLLREFKSKDVFEYSEIFSDKKTMDMFGGPPLENDLDLKWTIDKARIDLESNSAFFWVVTLKSEKRFIGFIRLMSYKSDYFDRSYGAMGEYRNDPIFLQKIDKVNGWEIDYALLHDYRNYGYMTEAINNVIYHCGTLNYSPIYAKVNSMKNTPTIKVLEKVGFEEFIPLGLAGKKVGLIFKWDPV